MTLMAGPLPLSTGQPVALRIGFPACELRITFQPWLTVREGQWPSPKVAHLEHGSKSDVSEPSLPAPSFSEEYLGIELI
jgi:hypothetical protein